MVEVVDFPSIVKNVVLEESTMDLFDLEILRGIEKSSG